MNVEETKRLFVGRVNWSSYNIIMDHIYQTEQLGKCRVEFAICILDKDNKEYRCEMNHTLPFFYHNEEEFPDDWCGEYISENIAHKWYEDSGIVYRFATSLKEPAKGHEKQWDFESIQTLINSLMSTGKFKLIGDVGKVFLYLKDKE